MDVTTAVVNAPGQSLVEAFVVAIFVSVTAPLILVLVQQRQRRRDKQQDYEHEVSVAKLAKEVAERQDAKIDVVKDTVDVVHTLVNSTLTEAMTGKLASFEAHLATLRESVALQKRAGHEPGAKTIGLIAELEAGIAEQQTALDDRAQHNAVAAKQMADHPEVKIP